MHFSLHCTAPSDGFVVEAVIDGEVVLAEGLSPASSRPARNAVDTRHESTLFQLLVLEDGGEEEKEAERKGWIDLVLSTGTADGNVMPRE